MSNFEESIFKNIKMFRAAMAEATEANKKELEAEIAPLSQQVAEKYKQKLENIKKIVQETGIVSSLICLFEEMRHYSQKPDRESFGNAQQVGITVLKVWKEKEHKCTTHNIEYIYGDKEYKFVIVDQGTSSSGAPDDHELYHKITLIFYEQEQKVVSCRIEKHIHPDVNATWFVTPWSDNPSILEVGNWITHVVEIDEKLKFVRQQKV